MSAMSSVSWFLLVGAALFALGTVRLLTAPDLVVRLVALNVLGSGGLLALVALAARTDEPDPVPHALALTGMVPYTLLAEAENPSLATAFVAVGAGWAAQVISIGILAGLTTVIMVLLMGLSRVLLAMSRDGLLPRWLSVTSPTRKTPVRLQLITGAAVALLAGFTQVEILEEMINIGTLSAFVLVSLAVVVLRRTRPDLPRAYRVPFSPVLPIVSALLCLYLMLNLTTLTWVRFAAWLLIGTALYFAYGRRHARVGSSPAG